MVYLWSRTLDHLTCEDQWIVSKVENKKTCLFQNAQLWNQGILDVLFHHIPFSHTFQSIPPQECRFHVPKMTCLNCKSKNKCPTILPHDRTPHIQGQVLLFLLLLALSSFPSFDFSFYWLTGTSLQSSLREPSLQFQSPHVQWHEHTLENHLFGQLSAWAMLLLRADKVTWLKKHTPLFCDL